MESWATELSDLGKRPHTSPSWANFDADGKKRYSFHWRGGEEHDAHDHASGDWIFATPTDICT